MSRRRRGIVLSNATLEARLRQGAELARRVYGEPTPNRTVLLLDHADADAIWPETDPPPDTFVAIKEVVEAHRNDSFSARAIERGKEPVAVGKRLHPWSLRKVTEAVRVDVSGIQAPPAPDSDALQRERQELIGRSSDQKESFEAVDSELRDESSKLKTLADRAEELQTKLDVAKGKLHAWKAITGDGAVLECRDKVREVKRELGPWIGPPSTNYDSRQHENAEHQNWLWRVHYALEEFSKAFQSRRPHDFLQIQWTGSEEELFNAFDSFEAEISETQKGLPKLDQDSAQAASERDRQAKRVQTLQGARNVQEGHKLLAQARVEHLDRMASVWPVRKELLLRGTLGRVVGSETTSSQGDELRALIAVTQAEIRAGDAWLTSARSTASYVSSTRADTEVDHLHAGVCEAFDSLLDKYERVHNDLILTNEDLQAELTLLEVEREQQASKKAVISLTDEAGSSSRGQARVDEQPGIDRKAAAAVAATDRQGGGDSRALSAQFDTVLLGRHDSGLPRRTAEALVTVLANGQTAPLLLGFPAKSDGVVEIPSRELPRLDTTSWDSELAQRRVWREQMLRAYGFQTEVNQRESRPLAQDLERAVQDLEAAVGAVRDKLNSGDPTVSRRDLETHLEHRLALLNLATTLQDEQTRVDAEWSAVHSTAVARAELAATRLEHSDRMRGVRHLEYVLATVDLGQNVCEPQALEADEAALRDAQSLLSFEVETGSHWLERVSARLAQLEKSGAPSHLVDEVRELSTEYSTFHATAVARADLASTRLEHSDRMRGVAQVKDVLAAVDRAQSSTGLQALQAEQVAIHEALPLLAAEVEAGSRWLERINDRLANLKTNEGASPILIEEVRALRDDYSACPSRFAERARALKERQGRVVDLIPLAKEDEADRAVTSTLGAVEEASKANLRSLGADELERRNRAEEGYLVQARRKLGRGGKRRGERE